MIRGPQVIGQLAVYLAGMAPLLPTQPEVVYLKLHNLKRF